MLLKHVKAIWFIHIIHFGWFILDDQADYKCKFTLTTIPWASEL